MVVNPTYYVRTNNPAEEWRNNLNRLMENCGMNITDLGRKMYEREQMEQNPGVELDKAGETYKSGVAACAKRMGRYLKPGIHGNKFPSFEEMLKLADFFGVSIGYLIGETKCKSPEAQQACDYTGLSEEAVNAVKLATARETAFKRTGMRYEVASRSLNKLLITKGFYRVLYALSELDEIQTKVDPWVEGNRNLEGKYDVGLLAKAFEYYDSFVNDSDPEGKKHNAEVMREAGVSDEELEEFIEAVNDVNSLMDKGYLATRDRESATKEHMFTLIGEFYRLIEELYPESRLV